MVDAIEELGPEVCTNLLGEVERVMTPIARRIAEDASFRDGNIVVALEGETVDQAALVVRI